MTHENEEYCENTKKIGYNTLTISYTSNIAENNNTVQEIMSETSHALEIRKDLMKKIYVRLS